MSSFGEEIRADLVWHANTGTALEDTARLRREFHASTAAMSDDALRLASAQERLDRALAKHGPTSKAARDAELALRRAIRESTTASNQQNVALDRTGRELGQVTRGAVVGSGALRGLGRSAAFLSASFLGGAGVIYGIRKALDASSNLKEQVSKSRVVFGDATDEVIRFADHALGLARDQALEAASGIGALLRPLGILPGEAARLSVQLTRLGVDFSSFSNTPVPEALDAIRSGLVGESEPLRRFSVLLSEARVQQEAMRASGKKHADELTNREKVLARIAIITKDAGQAEGDYARTIGSTANQERERDKNLRNTAILIGDTLQPAYRELLGDVNRYLGDAANQRKIQREVNKAVETGTEVVKGLAGGLDLVHDATAPVVSALGGLEHVVEAALVAGLVAKAAKAARAIAAIGTAEKALTTVVVAESAKQAAAIEAALVAGGAGGAGRAAAGGALGGLLGRGGGFLRGAGYIGAALAAVDIAGGKIPFTGAGIPFDNYGWNDLLGDIAKPFQGVREGSTGPATLRWTDVFPAIQGGWLDVAGVQGLKSRFATDGDYQGALAYARKVARTHIPGLLSGMSGGVTLPGRVRGSVYLGPTGADALTPYEQALLGVSEAPGQIAPLQTERSLLEKREAFLRRALVGAGPKRAREVTDELKANLAEQQQVDDEIQSIRDAATKVRIDKAKKAEERRAKLIESLIPDSLSGRGVAAGAFGRYQAAGAAKIGAALGMAHLYALAGKQPGLLKAGNLDLLHRPIAHNADGSISTVRSISAADERGVWLLPTVINGKVVSNEQAVEHFRRTGENLGLFKTEAAAEAYSERLHKQQATFYLHGGGGSKTFSSTVPADLRQSLIGGITGVPQVLDLQTQIAEARFADHEEKLLPYYRRELKALEQNIALLKKMGAGRVAILQERLAQEQLKQRIRGIRGQDDVGGGAQANQRQFLEAFQQIVGAYAPNAFPLGARGGKSETHLYEAVHELRQQTQVLHRLAGHEAFPATRHAYSAALAAQG